MAAYLSPTRDLFNQGALNDKKSKLLIDSSFSKANYSSHLVGKTSASTLYDKSCLRTSKMTPKMYTHSKETYLYLG